MKLALANEQALFNINNGFTITEEYSETLDSASVIISKLNHKINIAPFDFCNILFDNGNVFKSMLVDNYQIKEITLEGNKQYQATIELMSLTKLLEKIQLPNRVINHSLVNGQQTIQTYIEQYCDIYTPKIKFKNGSNWQYKKLFKVDSTLFDDANKFNVKCRDMGFSQPTLRQAITNLMLQVGCIPVIKADVNGELYLSYLDFNETQSIFNITDNSSNYTNYSNASDSKVNNLIVMADNILDDENVVINEAIPFRDKDNVLLKQESNLKLNTRLPIYDVERAYLGMFGYFKYHTKTDIDGKNGVYLGTEYDVSFNSAIINGNNARIPIINNENESITLSEIKVNCVNTSWRVDVDALGSAKVVATYEFNDITLSANETTYLEFVKPAIWENLPIYITTVGGKYCYSIFLKVNGVKCFAFVDTDNRVSFFSSIYTDKSIIRYDISKLVVENSKRQLLETDFTQLTQQSTLDDFSKYVYGTVGYQLGGTEISGFSQTYNHAIAWWTETKTYIEAIVGWLLEHVRIGNVHYEEYANNHLAGLPYEFIEDGLGTATMDGRDYKNLIFEIGYKPMNSMRLEISKQETIDLPISQFDSAESSIYALNDLAINEQEKVDRLGNEIITINQRTLDPTEIQPLNSKYGEYTIFKRTIAYENDFYKVNYVASKNYVLKNYFTSIQTKYRAYEYTSYDSAVIRKENTKVYVLIDKDYINGDDIIEFNNNILWAFASAITKEGDYKNYLFKYLINNDNLEIPSIIDPTQTITLTRNFKSELSVVDFKNNLVFSWQEFDSVSHGVYISKNDTRLGGLPQQWYIKSDDYYVERNNLLTIGLEYPADVVGTQEIILNDNYVDAEYIINENSLRFDKTYYADKQEKINQTLQFEYYCASGVIQWTNKMQELCYFKNDNSIEKVYSYSHNPLKLIDRPHLYNSTYDGLFGSGINVSVNKQENSITLSKENAKYIKVMQKISSNEYYDIAIIELDNNGTRKLYISLNDTKSFNVAHINENKVITFKDYKAKLNIANREVEQQ